MQICVVATIARATDGSRPSARQSFPTRRSMRAAALSGAMTAPAGSPRPQLCTIDCTIAAVRGGSGPRGFAFTTRPLGGSSHQPGSLSIFGGAGSTFGRVSRAYRTPSCSSMASINRFALLVSLEGRR